MINLEEILDKHERVSSFNPPNRITYVAAMKELADLVINLCAEKQAEIYKENGYTNTGKKIQQSILDVKDLIK